MPGMESIATTKKGSHLIRSTSVVACMTFISRIVGFLRDVVIAQHFGAVAGVDAYLIAFKIPNFMRRLFAEGAFSQAFVPVLAEYQQTRPDAVKSFIARIAGTLGGILAIVTVCVVLITPIIIFMFAPGFGWGTPRFELASALLRITFPYLLLISLTAMAAAILNTYGSFAIPAFTPVFLNLCLILAALFLASYFDQPVYALAIAILVAGIVQLGFQLPFLAKRQLLPRPQFAWRDKGVQRVLKLMLQALFGVSVAQVNLLLDTLFASFLPVGSVSWLYFSNQLSNFPLGVFGVAIATVILPHLSRQHAQHSDANYQQAIDWGLRSILFIAIPAAIGLALLAGPILATLFQYKKFTGHDVLMTRLSLMAFATGLPAFMLVKVLATAFYARKNIKTPVKIGVIAMVSNVVLNLILMFPLAHAGLALATSLAAMFNAAALFYLLIKRQFFQPQAGWWRFTGQIVLANGLLVAWIVWSTGPLADWFAWSARIRAEHLGVIIGVGIFIYLGSLMMTGLRLKHLRGPVY